MGAGTRTSDNVSSGETDRPGAPSVKAPDDLLERDRAQLDHLVTSDESAESVVEEILRYAAERLDLDQGVLARIDPAVDTHTVVAEAGAKDVLVEDATSALSDTYCREVVARGGPLTTRETLRDGGVDDSTLNGQDFECYIGEKVLVDDALYGTVSFVRERSRPDAFSSSDQALVQYVARLLGTHLSRSLDVRRSPRTITLRSPGDGSPNRPVHEPRIGGWELRVEADTFSWTEETYGIHGVEGDFVPTLDSVPNLFESESRAALRAALSEAIDPGTSFDLVLSLDAAGHKRRRLRMTGIPHQEEGTTTRIFGTVYDTSRGRSARSPIAPATFRRLVEGADPIFFMLDAEGTILVSQGATLDALGLEAGEEVGKSAYDLYSEFPKILDLVDRALSGQSVHGTVPIGGSRLDVWYAPVFSDAGTVDGCIGMATDVTPTYEMAETLREREAFLRSITENVREGICRTSPDEGLIYANSAFVEMFGYESEEELLGIVPERLYADPERRNQLLTIAEDTPEEVQEVRFRRQDGSTFVGRLSGSVVRDENGDIEYVDGVVVDISQEKKHQQELAETKARYQSVTEDVLDTSPVGTFILDSDFTIVWINQAIEEYFGVTREEVVGLDKETFLREYIPGRIEDPERFVETVRDTYDRNDSSETFECHVLSGENRSERWLEHQSRPIEHGWYEGGRVETYTDVTRLKDREQALRDERDLLNRVFQTSPSAIAIINEEGDFVRVSDRAQDILGLEKDSVTDRTYNDPAWEITAPDGSPFPDENLPFARVRDTDEPVIGIEHAVHWPDGSRRVLSVSGAPLHDETGAFQGAVFHLDDITKQRKTARNLRKSEERFRGVFESAALGIALVNESGEIIEANPALESMLGYGEGDLQGRHFENITHPSDADRDKRLYEELVSGERDSYQIEKRYVRADGESFWARLSVSRRGAPGDLEIVGVVENIDARKRRKAELRKFQKVVEQAHEAVLILEASPETAPGPKITYANPAFTSLTGYSSREAIGKPLQILHGPDTESWVLEALWSSFERGQRHEGEAINYRKDGSRFVNRWGLAPVRGEHGSITHWVFVQRDVTEERQMDRRLLQVEDAERRRIDAEMHDQVGGLLTTLQMTVEMGRMKTPDDEDLIEHFDQIESLVDDLSSVTRTISRRLHPQVLDDHGLNRALSTLAKNVENQHDLDVSIYNEVRTGQRLPRLVEMTAYRVVQEALVNIVRHADIDTAQVLVNKGDTELRLHVIDQGRGFDQSVDIDDSHRGLQGIAERVERLNGNLEITTAPGEGTRISATLPIAISSPPT